MKLLFIASFGMSIFFGLSASANASVTRYRCVGEQNSFISELTGMNHAQAMEECYEMWGINVVEIPGKFSTIDFRAIARSTVKLYDCLDNQWAFLSQLTGLNHAQAMQQCYDLGGQQVSIE